MPLGPEAFLVTALPGDYGLYEEEKNIFVKRVQCSYGKTNLYVLMNPRIQGKKDLTPPRIEQGRRRNELWAQF